MVFAMQFGSFIDGILVGNMIGGDALSATALVVPILYIIQLPGFALGVGGSIVIANLLGKRDIEGAKKTFTICLLLGLGISIIFAAIAFAVSRPLAMLFSTDLVEYSYQYILGYLLIDPLITAALLIGPFMAVDNNPRLSSILFIISNAAKVGLEVLFIKILGDWATFGSALSTGAGYLLGLITVIFYMKSSKRNLKFNFKMKGSKLFGIIKASSTSALNMLFTAIQMLVVNIFVAQVLTDTIDITIYGVIANMIFLFDLVCGGITNIIPTLCGIFYGEKDLFSLKNVTKKIYLINIATTAVLVIFFMALPGLYGKMFGFDDPIHFNYLAKIIRIYLISFIPYEISKFSMNYYPSIDKNLPSLVTVFLRELIIVIPVTLSLLFTMGLEGYVLAATITEVSTVIITYIFILIYEKVRRKECHGIFMFERTNFKVYDVSISNNIDNAALISENITKFALENGIPERESQIIGLASEEMVDNIAEFGYKKEKHSYIDVCLKISKDNMLLRIRDDGLPFDPTKYEFDNNENYSTSGIQLISKLVDKMSYMRVLNLNNTIFEIKLGGSVNGN